MMITKYEFRGEKDGISLLILAAVHGNETAGTQACFRIIDEFNRGALRLTGGHLTLFRCAIRRLIAKMFAVLTRT